MMQLFDFVIEDTEEAYINIYLVRQAGEGYLEKMVTLAEFKERFYQVQELKYRVEMLRRIVSLIYRFHQECGGVPLSNLTMNDVWIDSEDGEIYFRSFPFDSSPHFDIRMQYQGPEFLFNSPDSQHLIQNDIWSLGCIIYEILTN